MTSAKEFQQHSKSNYLYGVQYLLPHQFQNSSNKTKMLFSSTAGNLNRVFYFVINSSFRERFLTGGSASILVQGIDTGTTHWYWLSASEYWYSTLVLVQRTVTGTAYLYWYCSLLLVKRTATDTMHQNWYNALVLVKRTGIGTEHRYW